MKSVGKNRLKKIIQEEVKMHLLMESNARKVGELTNRATKAILDLIKKGTTTNESYEKLEADDLIDEGGLATNTKVYVLNIDFLPGSIDPSQLDDEFYEDDMFLSITLFLTPNENVHVSGDNINRLGSAGVHVGVQAPENITGEQWSMLRREISNTLRHEIEHMIQGLPLYYQGMKDSDGKEYKYDDFMLDTPPISDRAKDYYLKAHEVSAHIMGYAHNAKSLKDLENEIRLMLANWARKDWQKDSKQFIALEDVDIITDAWVDWAKKHLRGQRFK